MVKWSPMQTSMTSIHPLYAPAARRDGNARGRRFPLASHGLDLGGDGAGEGLKTVLRDLTPDVLTRLGTQETEAALFKGLQTLKPLEREVITAHALEGKSFKELSEAIRKAMGIKSS